MRHISPELRHQFDNPLDTLDVTARRRLFRDTIIHGLLILIAGIVLLIFSVNTQRGGGGRRTGFSVLIVGYLIGLGLYQTIFFKVRAKQKIRDILTVQYPELAALQSKPTHVSGTIFYGATTISILISIVIGLIVLR